MLQLTSLHSLQKSLDMLRSHRPAYTPRTGFVWPIVEPSSGDASAKKRTQDGETAPETQDTEDIPGARALANDSKRHQNNMLLFNAMRTTAVHARESFQLPSLPSDETVPETPVTATAGRSSVTPAPGPGGIATRAPSLAPVPQEPTKGPPGGGKKKKKSEFSQPQHVRSFGTELSSRPRDGYPASCRFLTARSLYALASGLPGPVVRMIQQLCPSHSHQGTLVGNHSCCGPCTFW